VVATPSTSGTFTARQGDTLPILVANLYGADDAVVDLSPTGTTVRFRMAPVFEGPLKVDAPAAIVNAVAGTVSYTWGATDLDTAGEFSGVFVVTIPGIGSETYPGGEITITVVPRVESTLAYTGLVSVAEYRLATLDTASPDTAITGGLERAQRIVADYLRRGVPGEAQPLISAERTELLIIDSLMRVYPSCVPITVLPGGLQTRGYAVYGVVPSFLVSFIIDYDRLNTPRTSLTYTGGWTPVTLPETVRQHICWKAWELLRTPLAQEGIPVGATAVHSGDASMTFKDPNPGGAAAARLSDGAKKELRPWRRIW
jgi:hypothetical protein